MSQTIEIDVGDVYADLNEQFYDELGDNYEQALRENVEDFIHQFNKRRDRANEQQRAQAAAGQIAEAER